MHKWCEQESYKQKYPLLEWHTKLCANHHIHMAFEIKKEQVNEVSNLK